MYFLFYYSHKIGLLQLNVYLVKMEAVIHIWTYSMTKSPEITFSNLWRFKFFIYGIRVYFHLYDDTRYCFSDCFGYDHRMVLLSSFYTVLCPAETDQ